MKLDLLGNNVQFFKRPFDEFLSWLGENDIKEIDFTTHVPHIYVDSYGYKDICQAKTKLMQSGVSVSCITPMPYRFSICADEGTIQRDKTIEYYKQCIDMAEDFGSPYVTITASGACYDYEEERLRANGIETLKILAEYAGNHGVTLLLGTVLGEECQPNASTPVFVRLHEIKAALDEVKSEALKAYLDTEVISLCGETITQWFELLGKNIALIRLTDGNYNGYRVWGMGCLPCRKYLQEIADNGYEGKFSLNIPGERYSENPSEAMTSNVNYLRETARQL